MSIIKDINMSNTEQNDVTGQPKRLILATATWCGPCYGLKKRLEKDDFYSKLEIKDADKDHTFFKEHDIKSVPRLLVFDAENNVESVQGVDEIYKFISANAA